LYVLSEVGFCGGLSLTKVLSLEVRRNFADQARNLSVQASELELEEVKARLKALAERIELLRHKRKSFGLLELSLDNHVRELDRRITALEATRDQVETSTSRVKLLKKGLLSVNLELEEVRRNLREAVHKEHNLLNELSALLQDYGMDLKKFDPLFVKRIRGNIQETQRGMKLDLADLITHEELFKGLNKLTDSESFLRSAGAKFKRITRELNSVQESRRNVLEKRQLLELSEDHAKSEMAALQKKYEKLKTEFLQLFAVYENRKASRKKV